MQIRIPEPLPPGLSVIETMRAEPDGRILLWPLHLQRLRRDCAAVGFPLDEAAVAASLAHLPKGQPLRVRLAVDATGQVGLQQAHLPPNPDLWQIALSPVRAASDDPWLRIKTTHRPTYEAARDVLSQNCQEAILLNERGEVCEGTITNVFVERDGILLTPPLECGVLPGVLRASLLAQGRAVEGRLTPDDLRGNKVFCGNALRGLIPARLVEPD